MSMEEYFKNLARIRGKDVLLICDRGTCDTFAYCNEIVRNTVLEKENWTIDFLNHLRYDKVIHLVTAANGAENFFGYENEARSESIEEAIDIDRKVQEVWFNHPKFVIVDNSDVSFNDKIGRVFNEITDLVSLPVEKFVRKFLLKNIFKREDFDPNIVFSAYKETIFYLIKQDDNVISYVIKREYEKTSKIIYTLKTRRLNYDFEKRVETSRQLTKEVYEQFYNQRNKSRRIIEKDCFYFRMEDNINICIYKIETFKLEDQNFSILHLTSNLGKKERKFPRFISVVREITKDQDYFTYKLSQFKSKENFKNKW